MFQDDEDETDHGSDELHKKLTERAKQEFIEGCYQAYDLLVKDGSKTLEEAEISSIQKAINRMTSYFIMQEEYEKCQFLKRFVDENMPGFEIVPDETIQKDLND
jgi:ferritin